MSRNSSKKIINSKIMSHRESNIGLEINSQQDNRTEKKENNRKLHEFSETISQKIKERYGGKNIVDNNIKINTDIFHENPSYTDEKIKEDEEFVEEKRGEFNKKKKINDSNGELFEEAMACVLYRILNKKYLVVRSSDYDDLHNGVDILIIDPETNEIICLVDNITTYRDDFKAIEAIENKENKVLNQNMNGGAEIEYGLAFKENAETHNIEPIGERKKGIPIFSMHLYGKELDELLNGMDYDINNDPSEIELKTFDELMRVMKVDSKQMIEQIQEESKKNDEEMKKKKTDLEVFENLINKNLVKKKERKKIMEEIRTANEYINNYPVRKKNKDTSIASLEKAGILFEKIKEVRDNSFQKTEA